MRKEPYSTGSYVHIIKRGNRGLPIVRDELDRQRFLLSLMHLNDTHTVENWFRELDFRDQKSSFTRPSHWQSQKKLTKIICFCLVENHFHLLLQETVDKGISRFMQKLGTSLAKCYNEKYQEQGTIFQGAYRSKTVSSDAYLRYVSAYIQVKNCFEIHPDRKLNSIDDFDEMFDWAMNCPYSSLGNLMGTSKLPIVNQDILFEIFTPEDYKEFCADMMAGRLEMELYGSEMTLE